MKEFKAFWIVMSFSFFAIYLPTINNSAFKNASLF